jgi:hypothetical protein
VVSGADGCQALGSFFMVAAGWAAQTTLLFGPD